MALYILLAGIMAGWWATLGVSLALIVQNRFVVMICPYLVLLFFHVVWTNFAGAILNVYVQASPIYFIISRALGANNNGWVILAWIGAILVFDALILKKKGMDGDVL